jgi:hypothetical protein
MFHSNTISEGGYVVGSSGKSKRKYLKNRGKIHKSRSKGDTWSKVKIGGVR